MVVVNFVMAHEAFFLSMGTLLIQEFIAGSKLEANSLGQLGVGYVKNLIAQRQAKLASQGSPAGK